MQYLDAISKMTEWSLFVSKANHSISQLSKSMPNQLRWRSWSWMVLWRHTRPFRTNTPKRCPFHYMELEHKSRNSRDTWSNMQVWPWSTKQRRSKANSVLPREDSCNSKHPLPTTQRTWTPPDGQHQNQTDYILCNWSREALYSQQKQDQEPTVAQIMNFLLPNSDLNWRK